MGRSSIIDLERSNARADTPVVREASRAVPADDKAMLKAAADLTRDLNTARPAIYWADLIGSSLLGYAALFAAMALGRVRRDEVRGLVPTDPPFRPDPRRRPTYAALVAELPKLYAAQRGFFRRSARRWPG